MFVTIFVKPLSMINHGVEYSECLFIPDVFSDDFFAQEMDKCLHSTIKCLDKILCDIKWYYSFNAWIIESIELYL
jgi:hypothetical protein